MITAENLTKRFGAHTAVDGISFEVRPGQVTGFLGPNGAGKSTTMRMVVGLDRPDTGSVTVNGLPFARHGAPITEIGALLDAKGVHPGRTAESHLRLLAATHGIGRARVDEVMELTGITSVARRRVGGFSLGMHQRLGIAATMLGDPHTLILDEPVNGLDPEGVHWVRGFVRSLAAEGRAIFLSSHLMSEMAQTADHIIVLGRGRILADAPVGDLLGGGDRERTRVRASDARELAILLAAEGVSIAHADGDTLEVEGVAASRIVRVAVGADIDVHELVPLRGSLEDAYLALTGDAVEYRSDPAAIAA
ncbi:ATP-binding cassette domain-containing protein [Microbacterium betulae]|uniref:ATP-binding cassette domain-containing protein n=1 Tax=Microbacterium betulae TaxID=2981139 RepID=A0AA97FHJ2_9MICO|nr:ATP-binding cassette domain-containing protein [Microbacterium sp. AB]WOF23008.1 ATP-binding cassette domain-containing protein [Microbacterium sp. AB]